MWRKRIAMAAVLATLVGVGAASPPAHAGGPGDPIYGDINGDGITDEMFLGMVNPDACSVVVEYGLPDGSLSPPVAFVYLRPGSPIEASCPDIGVAFNWDGDADLADELWVGWSQGAPPDLGYNRIILDSGNLRRVGTFTSPVTPIFMGTADFNGDGIPGNYSYGRGGFVTYIVNGATGSLGPEQWCSENVSGVKIKDFNDNRATDAVVAYTNGCTDSANGVVVVLDDGSFQQLEQDSTRQRTWEAKIVYADDDRIPDIRTRETISGKIDHFLGVGNGSFVLSPTAVVDTVTVSSTKKTAINILANDYATNEATVTIVTPPRYGKVQVTSSRTVVFTPSAKPGRTDRFVYQLTQDGKTSNGAVNIRFQN
jgi:hypothetical protein